VSENDGVGPSLIIGILSKASYNVGVTLRGSPRQIKMAGILAPSAAQPVDLRIKAADLAKFPTHLSSGDVDYELDQGRLILMVPPGHRHGGCQYGIAAILFFQGDQRGFGRGFTETGVMLSKNPDTVLVPDVAFLGNARLPERESPEGYLETIPDLVVEIRSKNDSKDELDRKAVQYLDAGVGTVWIVDPQSKTIVVHRLGAEPRVYLASDTFTSDEPIPGFRLNVGEVFRD
jgi:Uma2 family endonuclease